MTVLRRIASGTTTVYDVRLVRIALWLVFILGILVGAFAGRV